MKKPIVHDTFTIERTYPHPTARVFAAWTDPVKKRAWFAEGKGFEIASYELDFRVEGYERTRFRPVGGPAMTYDATYLEIETNEKIVVAYRMTMDGAPLSSSLFTAEFFETPEGTRLKFTEATAFTNGVDGSEGRRLGSEEMLDKFGEYLANA